MYLMRKQYASFIRVPKQRNKRSDDSDIKKGAIPLEFINNEKLKINIE